MWQILETPIWVNGNSRYVDFDSGVAKLFEHVRGNLGGIRAIKVIHTHPFYEVVVTEGSIRRIRSNELSQEDFQATVEFARRIPAGKGSFKHYRAEDPMTISEIKAGNA